MSEIGRLLGYEHVHDGVMQATLAAGSRVLVSRDADATGAVVLYAVYQYDVFGNRIEKAVDWDGDGPNAAVVTRYVLDGWNNMKPTPIGNEHFDIYAELDGTNQLIARYLHGDELDQTFAPVRVDGSTPEVHWLLTDHLNSVWLVLDESGALLDQFADDAFGNIVAQLNALLINPILFASREFDAETGLYYNRARYLDPTTGRWTTQDPLGFAAGDANLYRYVGNMATMATDPSGNIAFVPFVVAGALAGWWLLDPGAGTANAPAPGQENFIPPPRSILEDAVAGIPGAIVGAGTAWIVTIVVPAGTGPSSQAIRVIVNQNTLHNIFGQARHNLGPLLNLFRESQIEAYSAVYRATVIAIQRQGITGIFETVVTVGGLNITVRGRLIDGGVRIWTFFIP